MQLLRILAVLYLSQLFLFAGELNFSTKSKSISVAADAKKIEVLFPFENSSSEDVVIERYDAPCSCMSAKIKGGTVLSKSGAIRFSPGEKGAFKGIFELGNFKGTVDKKIVVWARGDVEESPSIVLSTKVTIPYLIAAFPRSLMWEMGSEAKPKVIMVKVDHDEAIKISKLSCSSPQFGYSLETIREGYEYKLTVTPKSTDKVLFAALRITTDSANPRYKTVQTFMTVKPENAQNNVSLDR